MKIVCVGRYGRKNVGDEIIARSLSRYLAGPADAEVVFSTRGDERKLQEVEVGDPFYRQHSLRRIDSLSIKKGDILLVGGGDLPAHYGMSHVVKFAGNRKAKLIARIGTSAKNDFVSGGDKVVEQVRSSYGVFDYISMRDIASRDVVRSLGLEAHVGADLAIDFPVEDYSRAIQGRYAVLTVSVTSERDAKKQLALYTKLGALLNRKFGRVVVLPMCRMDAEFITYSKGMENVLMEWSNPEKVASLIAGAEAVVSVGRLHPLVFAVGNRVPCFGVSYPVIHGYDKINAFMHHARLPHRVVDWNRPVEEIVEGVRHSLSSDQMKDDETILDVYGGLLKGAMLESLCPVWQAMGLSHGLGLERGLKQDEFVVDEYDESYYFGARVYKSGGKFQVYHPSRGDWGGWDTIRDLVISTIKPTSLIDVGCGRGWFVKRMCDAGVDAQGLDGSDAACSVCAPGMEKKIRVGTLKKLEGERYDVLTAFDVMEHIFKDELHQVIAALKKAARRYIVLNICTTPDGGPDFTIKRGESIPEELEWLAVSGHVTIRNVAWWKKILEDENWKVDKQLEDAWFQDARFDFDSWQRNNVVILKKKA